MDEGGSHFDTPGYLSPTTATLVLVVSAAVALIYCLMATAGAELLELPLVIAPLLALYWVARRLAHDTAIGWMIFGAGFIIVLPMVMFALVLSFSSRVGDTDLGISFSGLMTIGPMVQMLAVALLLLFARLVHNGPRR